MCVCVGGGGGGGGVKCRGGEWSSGNKKSRQILPKSRNLAQPIVGMGLGVSDFVSVGHIYAFLLSH